MHEELENFERNQVWTLVDPPRDVNVMGTKWVFKKQIGGGWSDCEEQGSPYCSRV
jgi:hypothetical protein